MLPKNELTIAPLKLYDLIIDIIDKNINFYNYNDQFIKLLTTLKGDFQNELKKTYNWNTILLSHKTCDHVYTKNSKKNGEICGRHIDIETGENNYKCSVHIKKTKYKPKKRIVDDIMRCPELNRYGYPCGLRKNKKYNGYCRYHYRNCNIKLEYVEKKEKKENKIDLKTYVEDMILYNIDTNFIYEKYFNNKDLTKRDMVLNTVEDNNDFHHNNKFTDIYKNVNKTVIDLYNKIKKENENLNVLENKDVNLKKLTVKECLDGGATVINDINHIKDICLYDLYSGKKIDTTKLIIYYKKINKIKMYIENNKKYIYLKNNNKNGREFYIKEKYINILLEYINLRYSKLYESLPDYEPDYWLHLLDEYKLDVDSIIIDFYNMDDKEKIYL